MIRSVVMAAALTFGVAQPAGVEQSVTPSVSTPHEYRGQWFYKAGLPFMRCVKHRESRGHYRSVNRSESGAAGAYQFLPVWRDSLVWMMLAESKTTKDGLSSQIRKLRRLRIDQWPVYYQDRAFWTALQNGRGAKHWLIDGSKCNRLAVAR